jgi:glycosyltransferase involved in cell wall biosynthesis
MAKVYAACDMLLYPTKADNLPLVVLESMACGTPVVASAIGGIPEIITHGSNGYLVTDFDSADAFMSQIAVYREMSEDGRSELAREAHSTVTQRFSMERMQESYMGLYKELMNNSL